MMRMENKGKETENDIQRNGSKKRWEEFSQIYI
jgi:hypothetical protein